jgi:hypothetical protein
MTVKITCEGQPCRHCQTPVVKRTHKPQWKPKSDQPYYFLYWFVCPNRMCKAIYMVESAKVWLKEPPEDKVLSAFNFTTEGL